MTTAKKICDSVLGSRKHSGEWWPLSSMWCINWILWTWMVKHDRNKYLPLHYYSFQNHYLFHCCEQYVIMYSILHIACSRGMKIHPSSTFTFVRKIFTLTLEDVLVQHTDICCVVHLIWSQFKLLYLNNSTMEGKVVSKLIQDGIFLQLLSTEEILR
jgi:hypothetical protein